MGEPGRSGQARRRPRAGLHTRLRARGPRGGRRAGAGPRRPGGGRRRRLPGRKAGPTRAKTASAGQSCDGSGGTRARPRFTEVDTPTLTLPQRGREIWLPGLLLILFGVQSLNMTQGILKLTGGFSPGLFLSLSIAAWV